MQAISPHPFHIPVMGLAYTIDSPIKVARFGINSAISIIEDNLVEMMRQYYYNKIDEPYITISRKEEDYRARRITDYLNLVNKIIKKQFQSLKESAFEAGSELCKYFEMLPLESQLRLAYHQMLRTRDPERKQELQKYLREEIRPGAVEVNIMTKLDRDSYDKENQIIPNGSDALAALRGYANSSLTNSAIIFSAGMNPRLYNYLEEFDAFDANDQGVFDKRIIIKVSDYRSALIQGKYLAKKGIWVSEFRVESGLNCGGHAFATDGYLLGPILQEFKDKREELEQNLFELYQPAVEAKGKKSFDRPHPIRVSVQGGIGTYEENEFLYQNYQVDSTGWGTPFLLCPEATTVDKATLKKLSSAVEKDVVLSKNSPLGVRFNYLKGTSSEKEKLSRIERQVPGSPCTEKFLQFNTEFTDKPICTASRKYQEKKIAQLEASDLSPKEYKLAKEEVLSKECLCIGLSNSAAHLYDLQFVKKLESVTVCPGPNIAYYSGEKTLRQMTDHIYGRVSILQRADRPHMFIKELQLYVDYIKEQIAEQDLTDPKFKRYVNKYCTNLLDGISHYKQLIDGHAHRIHGVSKALLESFEEELSKLQEAPLVA